MSNYVRSKSEEFTFEGKVVRVTIEPIEYGDMLGGRVLTEKDPTASIPYFQGLVLKYAKFEVAPLAADGSAITIEEVCSKSYFQNLMTDIATKVILTGRVPNPLA